MMKPEEIQPEVTADWAREQAETVMSEMAKADLNEVLSAISKAASSENKRVLHIISLHQLTVKELRRRGFKLEFTNAITRESSYWSIVW